MIKNWRYRQMIETTALGLATMATAAATMALPACSHDSQVAASGLAVAGSTEAVEIVL
jgi:hypothetical protein